MRPQGRARSYPQPVKAREIGVLSQQAQAHLYVGSPPARPMHSRAWIRSSSTRKAMAQLVVSSHERMATVGSEAARSGWWQGRGFRGPQG